MQPNTTWSLSIDHVPRFVPWPRMLALVCCSLSVLLQYPQSWHPLFQESAGIHNLLEDAGTLVLQKVLVLPVPGRCCLFCTVE